ncbi:MAG: putative sulfate exporter family transporter [Saprospiraceae bacterium]
MNTHQRGLFILAAMLCLTPYIQPPVALLIGIICAQTLHHPFPEMNSKIISWLLKSSVIGLGFGINLYQAIQAGKEGFLFTICSISLTILLGWILCRWTNMESKTSYLISCGTAICGGNAIAAISPIINANEKQMSISLGTVFILNAIALLIFPVIGHYLNMSQHQFGLWCAVAIHDTSSVVGAAVKFGNEALQVATTVKLERALFIIPLSVFTILITKQATKKIKFPYFIGLFTVSICIAHYFPQFDKAYTLIVWLAKRGLNLSLFLIGSGLSLETIKSVGPKPFVQGLILWSIISMISLLFIIKT